MSQDCGRLSTRLTPGGHHIRGFLMSNLRLCVRWNACIHKNPDILPLILVIISSKAQNKFLSGKNGE
jgi:hypothetical protein